MVNTGIVLDTAGKKQHNHLSNSFLFIHTAGAFQYKGTPSATTSQQLIQPFLCSKAKHTSFIFSTTGLLLRCHVVFCTEMRGTMHASLQSFVFALFDSP